MQLLKAASAVFCAASAIIILTPPVAAQSETGDYNRKTTVTFSTPVEIPGVHLKGYRVLPAGTYVFKLMDSTTNRHIVQIQSADEKKTYATILAIPNTRVQRTDKTVMTFRERLNGQPPALREWFYPDDAWGESFVYGKTKAKELAKSNNTPVLYSNDENQQAEVDEVKPPTQAQVKQMTNTQVMAATPSGDEVNMNQAVTLPDSNDTDKNATAQNTTAAPATNNSSTSTPSRVAEATPPASTYNPPAPAQSSSTSTNASTNNKTLPQTASPFGLVLLSGLFALGGAVGVQKVRQHA